MVPAVLSMVCGAGVFVGVGVGGADVFVGMGVGVGGVGVFVGMGVDVGGAGVFVRVGVSWDELQATAVTMPSPRMMKMNNVVLFISDSFASFD